MSPEAPPVPFISVDATAERRHVAHRSHDPRLLNPEDAVVQLDLVLVANRGRPARAIGASITIVATAKLAWDSRFPAEEVAQDLERVVLRASLLGLPRSRGATRERRSRGAGEREALPRT